jgi:23S rRNA (guanosine2251-2'-O)-methyltransferase
MPQYVYGKNSVQLLLENNPQRVFKVFIAEGLKPDKRIDGIFNALHSHGISYQMVPRQKLDGLLAQVLLENPDTAHQGVVASVSPRELLDIQDLEAKCKLKQDEGLYPFVLVLDGITDPGNFGSILRVADAAGVDGVVVAKHHSVGFNPMVSKSSSGADETVDVAVVPNLVQAMERLKKLGFWVVGSTLNDKAVWYYQQDYKMPTILVLGSEGKGMSRLIEEACDFWVKIPMLGKIQSLNVSTAASVISFEIAKQHLSAV